MSVRALAALVAVALIGSHPLAPEAVVSRSPDSAPRAADDHVRLVQLIETDEIGLVALAGITYATDSDELLVVGTDGSGQARGRSVTRLGTEAGPVALPEEGRVPSAIGFDATRGTLVAADASGRMVERAAGGPPGLRPSVAAAAGGTPEIVGLTTGPDGALLALDGPSRQVLALRGRSDQWAPAAELATAADLVGLAATPDGTFLTVDADGSAIYEFAADGSPLGTRGVGDTGLEEPVGAALAPSADPTDDPARLSLYVADGGADDPAQAGIMEFELVATPLSAAALAAPTETASLVRTIEGAELNPDSPDPSGMTYNSVLDRLVMTDGEIEEESKNSYPYPGTNGWVFTRTSPVQTTQTFDTTSHRCEANGSNPRNVEPVGVAWNPATGTYYVVRDGQNILWELSASFAPVRCLALSPFGVADAEGVAYGAGAIWIADGTGAEVWRLLPGPDGVFGTPTGGGSHDETATHFDTAAHGQADPEGIEFDPVTGTLYVVSNKDGSPILEITTTGQPVRILDVSGVTLDSARGLTLAPGTTEAAQHIYVADARVDNNSNGGAIDGRIYELAAGVAPPPTGPDTTITSGPSGTVTETSATFTFTGTPDTTSFECRLDGAAFTPCASPMAYSGLATDMVHTFEVRALAGSVADPTPATRSWTITSGEPPPPASDNLLLNPSFELDADGDSIPDEWGSHSGFTRSNAVAAPDGSFVGRHLASNRIIRQQVSVTAGVTYEFSGLVNLPSTSDSFSYQVSVQWRQGSSNLGSPVVIENFTDDTAGAWIHVAGTLTAPAGATSARIQMDPNSMNATGTAYVDAFFFGTGSPPPAPLDTTITSAPAASTTSTSATFEFTGSAAESFECRLDGGAWAACVSPRAYSGLDLGGHTFDVRAIGSDGQPDDTPASHSWTIVEASPATELLTNAGFEVDADGNTIPDDWGSKDKFTRSSAITPHGGAFVGRHFATNNSGYQVFQDVAVDAGAGYDFSGWVNVPSTSDSFTFRVRVRWMSGSTNLSTETVGTFTASTAGWQEVAQSLVAPSGATSARVMMVVSSLNGAIYVDDFSLMAAP